MGKAQSDLIARHTIETEFFPDYVIHPECMRGEKNRNEKVMEDQSNCGELGGGDFGVTHSQIEKATSCYHSPEVLGLDSNSEAPDHINCIDVWSLGCVIYELLVGKYYLSRSFMHPVASSPNSPFLKIGQEAYHSQQTMSESHY